MHQAGAGHVVAEFVHERVVDVLGLVGGGPGIGIVDAGSGRFEHVADAGPSPGAKPEEDIVHKAHRVEPQHRRINPAIDRNKR